MRGDATGQGGIVVDVKLENVEMRVINSLEGTIDI